MLNNEQKLIYIVALYVHIHFYCIFATLYEKHVHEKIERK